MLVLELLVPCLQKEPSWGKLHTRRCPAVNAPAGCVDGWERDDGFLSLPLLSAGA